MIRGSRYKLPVEIRVIRYCRLRFGFTQKRMAVILGINQSQVSRLERGLRVMTKGMRKKFEDLTNMKLEDLIREFANKLEEVAMERGKRKPSTLLIVKRIHSRVNEGLSNQPIVVKVWRQTLYARCTRFAERIFQRKRERGEAMNHNLLNYGILK